jgi:XTP/dITP diphosphohydrolase
MDIRFISGNKFKISEAQEIMSKININIVPVNLKIEEIQTEDTKRLVKDKVLKAFKLIGRPLFVEHTGLYLEHLNGFPGGLTQIFWDTLQADKFSELFGNTFNTKTIARTVIGYCDGYNIHYFDGEVLGRISSKPEGDRSFQWDCVFVPDSYDKTFSDLGPIKNEISMRKIALDKFAKYLNERRY